MTKFKYDREPLRAPVIWTRESDPRPSRSAHKLVYETAYGMAQAMYEALMLRDGWYNAWKARNPGAGPKALERRFCLGNVGGLLPSARATLAEMLAKPIDEAQKSRIMEALVLDRSLMRDNVPQNSN